MTALRELLNKPSTEPTKSTVTSIFCDGETRTVDFYRRDMALHFYTTMISQALLEIPYPKHRRDVFDDPGETKHIMVVTLVERDRESDEVMRTMHSDVFTCSHLVPSIS